MSSSCFSFGVTLSVELLCDIDRFIVWKHVWISVGWLNHGYHHVSIEWVRYIIFTFCMKHLQYFNHTSGIKLSVPYLVSYYHNGLFIVRMSDLFALHTHRHNCCNVSFFPNKSYGKLLHKAMITANFLIQVQQIYTMFRRVADNFFLFTSYKATRNARKESEKKQIFA